VRAGWRVHVNLRRLVEPVESHATNERHLDDLFTFILAPAVDTTNRRAEQAIRPPLVSGKLRVNNLTWDETGAQPVLMTPLVTAA